MCTVPNVQVLNGTIECYCEYKKVKCFEQRSVSPAQCLEETQHLVQ